MGFFEKSNIITKVFTVCELGFEKENAVTRGENRFFNALSIRLSGNASICGGDFSLSLKNGDIMYMPKHTDFQRHSRESEHVIAIHFDTQTPVSLPDLFTPNDCEELFRHFHKINYAWKQRREGYIYEAIAIMNLILRDISRQKATQQTEVNTYENILRPAMDHINENFTENDFSVEHLADLCHVSPSYFRRIFRKNYSLSPIEYIINTKINYATELLETGYYSIKEVAEKCGIPNSKYFSTLYKKRTGNSPSGISSQTK